MRIKNLNNNLWALAPQYADSVFASLREGVNTGVPASKIPEAGDLPGMISRRERSTAVITIRGALSPETYVSHFSGTIYALGYDTIRLAIKNALAEPLVDSILLSIDSPGGSVGGVKELADFIREAASIKKMAAYANGLCASAAFWLASATGKIYAPATALVGSIGVIMCVADWSAFYARQGLKMEYITSGRFKAAGQDGKELSEEERAYFENQMAQIHDIFKADVAAGLGLTAAEPLWAEAQLIPALAASELGLVSRIVRDEEEALKLLADNPALEEIMEYTLAALEKDAPELLASIRKEAYEKGQKEAPQADALALACMRLACSEEQAANCEKMLAEARRLNLTAGQIAAFGGFLAQTGNTAPQSGSDITPLEAIIGAHKPPVNAESPKSEAKNRLLADAERRAAAVNGGKNV